MSELYELVLWPESQEIIEKAHEQGWYNECVLANPLSEKQDWLGSNAWFVPKIRMDSLQRVNRENLSNHLLVKQLSYVDKTKYEIIDDDRWRFNWAISREQYEHLRRDAIKTIKKVLKCNTNKAKDTFDWFYQRFGLRIKN